MNIFQSLYDRIKAFTVPKWYRKFMQEIQDLIVSILLQVGQTYIQQVQVKILEVSKMDIPSEEKFVIVFEYGRELLPTIKESFLRFIIELVVNRLKINKAI